MSTKIELEIRIRELERRLENDEQDMVEVCERIDVLDSKVDNFQGRASDRHGRLAMARARYEKAEAERDEYKKSSNDWARHFKSERTARISAEAEAEKLQKDFNVERNARDRAEELRCDAQAELAQLKRERASGRDWNNLSKALAKAEAEVARLREEMEKVHRKTYGVDDDT